MALTAHSFVLALAVLTVPTTAVQVSNCSEAEMTDVGTYAAQCDEKIAISCAADSCSSECLENVEELVELLPDCECLDGTNYRQSLLSNITACGHDAVDSTSGSGGTTLVASLGKASRPSTTNSGNTSTTHTGTTTGGHDENTTGAGNGSPVVGVASLSSVAVAIAVAVIQLIL